MSKVKPWTWEQLKKMLTFSDEIEDADFKENYLKEMKVVKFIQDYGYAGALALEIARWLIMKEDKNALAFAPLCMMQLGCSNCLFNSDLGNEECLGASKEMYNKLATAYLEEYSKVYGNA